MWPTVPHRGITEMMNPLRGLDNEVGETEGPQVALQVVDVLDAV